MKKFEDTEADRIGRMRPGIIKAIDEFEPGDIIKASKIDSNYRGRKIGSNIKALVQAGLAEKYHVDSSVNKYVLKESLEPAYEVAQTAFRVKILRELDSYRKKALNPVEDITRLGINDAEETDSLIQYHGEGYHDDTVEFLSNLDIIKRPDNREYISDKRDREFIEKQADEWQMIAQNLLTHSELPDRHKSEIDRYNSNFGTKIGYRKGKE